MSSLDINKDFLSNVEYLSALAKEVENKSTEDMDSNLMYEVVYADMYITRLLLNAHQPDLVSNLNDIKYSLDLVMTKLPFDKVKEAKDTDDYINILKKKYGNLDNAYYEEKVAYTTGNSSVKAYFFKRFPSIALMYGLGILLLSGSLRSFISGLTDKIVGAVATPSTETAVSETAQANVEMLSNMMGNLGGTMSTLMSLILMVIFIFTSTTIMLDLLYLTMPMFRALNQAKFVSVLATQCIEETDKGVVSYRKIRSFDRQKRNLYWLDAMLSDIEEAKVKVPFKLKDSLQDIKTRLNSAAKNTSEYFMLIAKIEFLHDDYLQIINFEE